MNLVLRPLSDVNDVTWSIIWILIILLASVFYVIVYILRYDELNDVGSNQPEGCGSGSNVSSPDSQNRGCGEGSEGTEGESSQS